MPDETQLLQTPGFNPYAAAPEQEIPQSVFDDPELKELARRVRMSPEEIARERIAQHLGVGKKGVGGVLQKILGIAEAAGSGFVGQRSIPDKLRTRAYEEYKTLTPQLERQLEAGIRNKAAAEKEASARFATASKYSQELNKLAAQYPEQRARIAKLQADVDMAGKKGATEEQKQALLRYQAEAARLQNDLQRKYGVRQLPGSDVSNMLSGGTTLGAQDFTERYKQGAFTNKVAFPGMAKIFAGMGGGGGERVTTSTTQGHKVLTVDNGDGTSRLVSVATEPTTTTTRRGGGGGSLLDQLPPEVKKSLLDRFSKTVLQSSEANAQTSAATLDEEKLPSAAAPVDKKPVNPSPAAAAKAFQRKTAEIGRLKANTTTLATGIPNKNADKLREQQQSLSEASSVVNGVLDNIVAPTGEFLGEYGGIWGYGAIGPGSPLEESLRKMNDQQTPEELTTKAHLLMMRWKKLKEMSGQTVTEQEQKAMSRIMGDTSDRKGSVLVKALVYKLMLEHTRALGQSQTLDPTQWKAMGLGDDAVTNIDKFVREKVKWLNDKLSEREEPNGFFEKHLLGGKKRKMTPGDIAGFKASLSLENALPAYRRWKQTQAPKEPLTPKSPLDVYLEPKQ